MFLLKPPSKAPLTKTFCLVSVNKRESDKKDTARDQTYSRD